MILWFYDFKDFLGGYIIKITNPELKVVRFANEDVIATSFGPLSGTDGLFYIPSGDYSGTYSGTGNYVEFNGTFSSYSNGVYGISGINGAKDGIDGDRNNMVTGTVYFPDVGITLPSSVMANIAKGYYDAYSYGDGQYYTNGVSYYETYYQ